MALTPYDWNQSIQTRAEYLEDRLREGSPVAALSRPEGLYLVSVHRAQRKVYEIYDRLMFAGLGNQSDVEAMRSAAIDFAHREGFLRSPDDVTAQRLVGSVLSPALKQAFADPFSAPFVFRGLFAELGESPEQDLFLVLGGDGDYRADRSRSAAAGTSAAETRMLEVLDADSLDGEGRDVALRRALRAWAAGRREARRRDALHEDGEGAESAPSPEELDRLVREEAAAGTVEVGFLDRASRRTSRFRLLVGNELAAALP